MNLIRVFVLNLILAVPVLFLYQEHTHEHGLFNVAVIRVLFSFNVKAVMHFIHKKQLLYETVRGCYFLAKLTALLMFL